MADFSFTHYITLTGDSETGTELSWTGHTNSPSNGVVTDTGTDNILTEDQDLTSSLGVDFFYSGWYVAVGGQNFGVFEWSGNFIIPYNSSEFDLRNDPSSPFISANDGNSSSTTLFDATLENAANCFLTGTRIATPTGECAIETLRPGDHVTTSDGRSVPVRWVWTQDITNIFGLGENRAPVRVSAQALGPNCPSRDLILTADHALYVDGLLINAGALVNGTTIQHVPLATMPNRFTYWHVETEDHTLLIAENCPSETFIDYVGRDGFDNYAEYKAAGGKDDLITEMAFPRISSARLVPPQIKARLAPSRVA